MDAATAVVIQKAVSRIGKEIIDYLEYDQSVAFGLKRPAYATFSGIGIGIGCFQNDVLQIVSEKGGGTLKLACKAFSAELRIWNGPDLIPNDWDDGSMEASLWHDLLWNYRKSIAKVCGMTEQEVMKWANGVLSSAWEGYARMYHKEAMLVPQKAKAAWNITEIGRRVYHPFKKIVTAVRGWFVLAVVCSSLLAGCGGCSTPPDWHMDDANEVEPQELAPEQKGGK